MKRIVCLLLAACMLFTLSGCGTGAAPQVGAATIWSSSDSQNAEIMAKKIIQCLTTKDQEGLSALFCTSVRGTQGFTHTMGNLYGLFNYDSYVSYSCEAVRSYYGKEGDKEILRLLQAEIVYIEVESTDANGKTESKFYGLEWYWVITNEENPDLVGIHQLTVHLLNTDQSVTLGNLNFCSFP